MRIECDTPAEARERTIVSTSSMPAGLTPAGIDAYVGSAPAAGQDLHRHGLGDRRLHRR